MAPEKRKATRPIESSTHSRAKSFFSERPTKRSKSETLLPSQNQDKALAPTRSPQRPEISNLRQEDVPFPRGGASILTPLEHKQISIEAARDVLFEQQSSAQIEETPGENPAKQNRIVTRQRKLKGRKQQEKGKTVALEEESTKIEGLSYARLTPGSLVLGQVCQINAHDIALALPNNLVGYVPVTSISDLISTKIEALASSKVEDESSSDEEMEQIDLKTLFSIGQHLRASVVSTYTTTLSSDKSKKRIELSLRPQDCNSALTSREIVSHTTLMGSVLSVEDHGLIIDIGSSESGVRGFISSREVGVPFDHDNVKEGSVLLCMVLGLNSNGKIVKLSADPKKFESNKKSNHLTDAPSVKSFLPGTLVELLIMHIDSKGLLGKMMGMIDATADLIHSGASTSGVELKEKYKIGQKIKARIVWTSETAENGKVGVSLLDHVLAFRPQEVSNDGQAQDPLSILQLSTVLESVKITKVIDGIGLLVNVGVEGVPGFVHISRIADKKIDKLPESSGPYKINSQHQGRIIGYNSLDGMFIVSLEPRIIAQPFLRIEDVKVGEIVHGTIQKILVNSVGVGGVLISLADGLNGLVPLMHMADTTLLHPEKKFREGSAIKARVLSTDTVRRTARLTLKKSLVNSEAPILELYENVEIGMQSPGTIVNILPTGAVVQFYGKLRGFLPVSEMSEAFIEDPTLHFRVGQVVNIFVLTVDAELEKLTVSCREPSSFDPARQKAFKNIKIGEIVEAKIIEKSGEHISAELEGTNLRAILRLGHLTDGSSARNLSLFKQLRIGQRLTDLTVIEKFDGKHVIYISNKATLVKAARDRTLLRSFDDVKENRIVQGFAKNITSAGVFVQFGGGLAGLLPKNRLPKDRLNLSDFGFKQHQSVTVRIATVDQFQQRFLVSMLQEHDAAEDLDQSLLSISKTIDATSQTAGDLAPGKLTTARIVSIKETQLNVIVLGNIQGRIDVSQIFDNWEDIKDRKHPLRIFSTSQELEVRVLGVHDARTHKFLPISHREGKTTIFELSAKLSDLVPGFKETLKLDSVSAGSSWIAFVNNIQDDCLWVNISPNIRGRIRALDITEDIGLLNDLEANFPKGSAMKVYVKSVDIPNNRLDLSRRSLQTTNPLTFENITKGMVLLGRVTKVTERIIMVQLDENLSGSVYLTDLADDFKDANPSHYSKNEMVRVCVLEIDVPNKRIRLCTRPSRVLNSSSPIKDPEIVGISQLKVNDVRRGFVKNVADNGLFINLGGNVTAYARVSDLSDSYLKEWKPYFHVDQLVESKVLMVDEALNHVQVTLKRSIIDNDYSPPITIKDLKVGQIVTGKVRKVEDFGVFIVIDDSRNVSGLCHRTEIADGRVPNVKNLYKHGDDVKAKVLKIDIEKNRISFGLKSSYLIDVANAEDMSDGESSDDSGNSHGIAIDERAAVREDAEIDPEADEINDEYTSKIAGHEVISDSSKVFATLDGGEFDWSGNTIDLGVDRKDSSTTDGLATRPVLKGQQKPLILVDHTGDLDVNGPQSADDFERLLLGTPDSSVMWIEYMSFQVRLGELATARNIAERALRTINIKEETDKMNIWIALLNLENVYGSDESIDAIFERACQFNDPQEIHERLASIYIQSGKKEKADALFQRLLKKFSQSPQVWYNSAHFLFNIMMAPDRARLLLPRALQSLPPHAHLNLTAKFAALEFQSPSGSSERGRTIYEGLVTAYPSRIDLWNQLLDLEIQYGDKDMIRPLFQRVIKIKKLKPKGAKAWFKRWSEWEEKYGDTLWQDRIAQIAKEWVRSSAAAERQGN